MKTPLLTFASALVLSVSLFSCKPKPHDPLACASREDKNGWIYVHLEGSPHDIGYQHGYLVAKEIDTLLKVFQFYLPRTTQKNWAWYREAAGRFMWSKIDTEYQQELIAMSEGLRAKGMKYDSLDLVVLNANIDLSSYSLPQLMNKTKPGSGDNRAPGNCSAFIATGKYTRDGKIVIAHNNWTDYIEGERWNVIADIKPAKGNHFIMDCAPGFIHSGDDFVVSSSGILITETTITQFKGFDTTKTPEFVRARKAAQYANSIDYVVKIMTTDNNGGYANDWLIGDTKTNEVAKLDVGLKNYKVWRSKDTAIIGSNFPSDPKLIKEETTFNVSNKANSPNARRLRMEKLVAVDSKGKLDPETGKAIEGDTYNALSGKTSLDRCVIDGHVELDPVGVPEWGEGPFYPMGAVQGKVSSTGLAKKMSLWAHMGHPGGADFLAGAFFK